MQKSTIQKRLEISLKRSASAVFLRSDFDRFGGYHQVGRALRNAVKKGLMVKAGYGIYVKAKASSLTGNPIPVVSLVEIGLTALTKLGFKPELGKSFRDYADGRTTQMPMATVLNVGRSRVTRRIGFGGNCIRYE